MKAVLYLDRINQEMIREDEGPGMVRAIDRQLDRLHRKSDWGGNVWDKSCCIINISKFDPDIAQLDKLGESVVMRREAFGGLVWVRRSNAVYQVDEQAFMALVALDAGRSPDEVAGSIGATRRELEELIEQLAAPASGSETAV